MYWFPSHFTQDAVWTNDRDGGMTLWSWNLMWMLACRASVGTDRTVPCRIPSSGLEGVELQSASCRHWFLCCPRCRARKLARARESCGRCGRPWKVSAWALRVEKSSAFRRAYLDLRVFFACTRPSGLCRWWYWCRRRVWSDCRALWIVYGGRSRFDYS